MTFGVNQRKLMPSFIWIVIKKVNLLPSLLIATHLAQASTTKSPLSMRAISWLACSNAPPVKRAFFPTTNAGYRCPL